MKHKDQLKKELKQGFNQDIPAEKPSFETSHEN